MCLEIHRYCNTIFFALPELGADLLERKVLQKWRGKGENAGSSFEYQRKEGPKGFSVIHPSP